jgi:hypothetical protein
MNIGRGTAALTIAMALFAAGCSSSSDSSSSDTTTPTTQAAPTTAASPTTAAASPTTAAAAASTDPMSGVPAPAGATQLRQDQLTGGGVHTAYTTTEPPAQVVSAYQAVLQGAGWTVQNSGGGGSAYGGNAGLTATEGARHLSLEAGGPTGQTFVDLCVWTTKPSNNSCGSDNDDNENDNDEDNNNN